MLQNHFDKAHRYRKWTHKAGLRMWSALACLGVGTTCGLLPSPTACASEPPVTAIGPQATGDQDNPAAFAVQLQLNRTTILPFEPVGAIATLRNVSGAPAALTDSGWGASYWIRLGEEGYWGNYRNYYPLFASSYPIFRTRSLCMPPPPPTTRVFASQEKFETHDTLAYIVGTPDSHGLRDPGTYFVYARYGKLESPSTTLVVRQPDGSDATAYQFLLQHSPDKLRTLDRYFSSDALHLDLFLERQKKEVDAYSLSLNDSEENRLEIKHRQKEREINLEAWREQLTTLIRLHPQSRYAQWGRLSVLFLESVPITLDVTQARDRGRVVTDSDLAKLRTAHAHAVQLASQLPDVLSGAAWYEAGVMSTALDQRDMAGQEFKKATFRDVTISKRIEERREYLR